MGARTRSCAWRRTSRSILRDLGVGRKGLSGMPREVRSVTREVWSACASTTSFSMLSLGTKSGDLTRRSFELAGCLVSSCLTSSCLVSPCVMLENAVRSSDDAILRWLLLPALSRKRILSVAVCTGMPGNALDDVASPLSSLVTLLEVGGGWWSRTIEEWPSMLLARFLRNIWRGDLEAFRGDFLNTVLSLSSLDPLRPSDTIIFSFRSSLIDTTFSSDPLSSFGSLIDTAFSSFGLSPFSSFGDRSSLLFDTDNERPFLERERERDLDLLRDLLLVFLLSRGDLDFFERPLRSPARLLVGATAS
mmetsp:Transcript_810/g.2940  ORF Transcript_810/g.2940 Transcript_810/m.2940 type:complete len:305 (-) Transcript_810:1233-2147(-)